MERTAGNYLRELDVAIETALDAGAVVREFYEAATAETYIKGDGSPVTDADLASDRIIRERLGSAFPADAILTEEGVDDGARLMSSRCWVVDPIDGTQQFIDRTGEFDVLIALVEDGRPVVSVLYQPSADQALIASAGGGAWVRRNGATERVTFQPVAGSSHARIFTSTYFGAPESLPALSRVCERIGAPAPGVSPCGVTTRDLLPGGRFDAMVGAYVPYREQIAWEWDFAASDLFVHEAGGRFTNLRGELHRYNKPGAKNHHGLLMTVDAETHQRLLDAVATEFVAEVATP